MSLSKRKIIIYLIIIGIISIPLKLYATDFSAYTTGDATTYTLYGISYKYGDFAPLTASSPGWPAFLSVFYQLIDSENFITYTNTARMLSLIFSIISIGPMYLLARKFFPDKFSLFAVSLFAFEPHLNLIAGSGLTEPLFILIFILSFYFILNSNNKFVYLSFLCAAILWTIRWNGAIMLIILSIIFFINFRSSKKIILKYFACVAIFFLVASPLLIQRYEQWGDPLYFTTSQTFFTGEFGLIQSDIVNRWDINYSAFDYINDNGIMQFFNRFILTGTTNILEHVAKLSFPYLFIFIPFGMLFSLRAFDQNPKYIKANWVLLLLAIGIMAITFAVMPHRRYMFFILPFLIIFATLPIHRVITHGLSTFSFSEKQKNISLIIVMTAVLISSGLYTLNYNVPDSTFQQERSEFSKYVHDNYDGKILDAGGTLGGLRYLKITDPPEIFKTFRASNHVNSSETVGKYYRVPIAGDNSLATIAIFAKSMDDFIVNGEKYDLKYIAIKHETNFNLLYPFLNDIYENEKNYPYLKKIFDYEDSGYKKFKVKVFEVDYNAYHSMNTT